MKQNFNSPIFSENWNYQNLMKKIPIQMVSLMYFIKHIRKDWNKFIQIYFKLEKGILSNLFYESVVTTTPKHDIKIIDQYSSKYKKNKQNICTSKFGNILKIIHSNLMGFVPAIKVLFNRIMGELIWTMQWIRKIFYKELTTLDETSQQTKKKPCLNKTIKKSTNDTKFRGKLFSQ